MSKKKYLKLAEFYRECLLQEGDTPIGMGWPREKDNLIRFQIMSDLFMPYLNKGSKVSILDFGCGTSHFYEYLIKSNLKKYISYTGVDIVQESIEISKNKYPNNSYYCIDILNDQELLGEYDFIVINGIFTQKRSMKNSEMKDFFKKILIILFSKTKTGIAFNTMSEFVDYRKRGAFHMNQKWLGLFLVEKISRLFTIRHDYGLYETTVYVFKGDK